MRRKLGVIALMGCVVLVGSCGDETWHHFVMFGARAKQGEVKRNLRTLCLAQKALLAANTPSATYRGLGEELERGNRYAYFVAPGAVLERQPMNYGEKVRDDSATGLQADPKVAPRRLPTEADVPPLLGGVKPGANGSAWVMAAVGDLDVDPEFDVWSVSTGERVAPDGRTVASCVPYLEHDDIPPGPIRALFK